VVPVDVDDRTAPLGCAALRELRRRPLVLWAASALQSSGVAREVVVAVPPALQEAVAQILPASEVPVEVLPVQADGHGHRLLAALRARPATGWATGRAAGTATGAAAGDADVVVVHDPLHPLSSPGLVRDVVRDLLATPGLAASIPARAVTDTLKWVDEDEVVLGTADREAYRMVYSPQAYRRGALQDALSRADDQALRAHGCEVLPHLVQACGGAVSLVPSGGEALRVAGEEDLVLAEARLHVADRQA
jgi:2-C-methyl-D-erythritol 4-phosphate cytidylyltransferase